MRGAPPMKRTAAAVTLALCAALASRQTHAQNSDTMDIRSCTAIESDAQRLACYDQAAGRAGLPAARKKTAEAPAPSGVCRRDNKPAGTVAGGTVRPLSLLDSRWELSPESKLGTYNIRGYKPVLIMPVFAT